MPKLKKPRTWYEARSRERMRDPVYAAAYREARAEIDAVDALVRELDDERKRQGLTKAALAERSGVPAMSLRRLFTAEDPDPKLSTIMPISQALGRPLGLPKAPAIQPALAHFEAPVSYKSAKNRTRERTSFAAPAQAGASKLKGVSFTASSSKSKGVSLKTKVVRKGSGRTPTGAAT